MSQKFLPVDSTALRHLRIAQQPLIGRKLVHELSVASRIRLLAIGGVLGYGFSGDDEIVVYVTGDEVVSQLPEQIEGLKVRAELTGLISALGSLP